jgi:hypothetical protein
MRAKLLAAAARIDALLKSLMDIAQREGIDKAFEGKKNSSAQRKNNSHKNTFFFSNFPCFFVVEIELEKLMKEGIAASAVVVQAGAANLLQVRLSLFLQKKNFL